MLRVRTLGACEILVGNERLGVEQPLAFALLFVIAMRPAATLSRRELAELLWPGTADRDRNHRLRSLLHRLRRLGAPLRCSNTTIMLEHATIDFRELVAPPTSIADVRVRLPFLGPVMPQLAALPPALADRLERERDVIVATATRWLLGVIALAKASGDWSLVEDAARRARDIDPDNETAAEALEETRCLTNREATGDIPLIGRDEVLQRLWSAAARAADGHGSALLLWGPAGIGKTRLLGEAARLRFPRRARVISAAGLPVHALRPLALILDLARRLLDEPGAAGCDPAAYRALRHWLDRGTPNEPAAAIADVELFDAFIELLSALSEESPVVLAVDDMHLVDQDVWRLLRAVIRWSADRRIVWLLGYRALRDAELAALPEESVVRRIALRSLDLESARMLVGATCPFIPEALVEQILDIAGGHPGLLCEVARNRGILPARAHGVVEDTIARLPRPALRVLRFLAGVGGAATLSSLAEGALFNRVQLADALGELEGAGLLRQQSDVVRVYGVWAETALATLAGSERLAMSHV